MCVYLSLKFLGAKQTPKNGGGFLCVCVCYRQPPAVFLDPWSVGGHCENPLGGRERKDHHEAERETRKCANKMDNGHVIQQVFSVSCFFLITSQKMTNKPVRFDCLSSFVSVCRNHAAQHWWVTLQHWKCGWPIVR